VNPRLAQAGGSRIIDRFLLVCQDLSAIISSLSLFYSWREQGRQDKWFASDPVHDSGSMTGIL